MVWVKAVEGFFVTMVCALALSVLISYGFTDSGQEDSLDSLTNELLAKQTSSQSLASLQKLERIHVMKCAKDITGSDKPRKLAPELRAKVLKCANDFMPPVKTKALLAASAREMMTAAKTPEQKQDARTVLAKATGSTGIPVSARSAALSHLTAKKAGIVASANNLAK